MSVDDMPSLQVACNEGQYLPARGLGNGCQACEVGKYASEGAMGSCTLCPTGTTTLPSTANSSIIGPEGPTGAKSIELCRQCVDDYCNGNGDCEVQ